MRQSSGIGVLDKTVAILRAVAAEPADLADLTDITGIPRATVHRLAVALEKHRLLARNDSGQWRPGPMLGELAKSAPDPLLLAAQPVLNGLRDDIDESTQLYQRHGTSRICVAAAERTSGLRDSVPVGALLPMTAGSGAQILAAWESSTFIQKLANEAAFTARTLADVRRRGWAQSLAEREAGVASVSAPVRDSAGAVIAAISVSGPTERLGRKPGARLAPAVLAAAAELARHL